MDIVLLFFSQKTIEQCQTSSNPSKTLGKWLRSSNDWRKCKKWLVFYLRRRRKCKEAPPSSSENPLAKSVRNKLPVEAWGYITPSASDRHVSTIQLAWELAPWRHVRFPPWLTRSARAVILNNIQTSKYETRVENRARHHVLFGWSRTTVWRPA